MSNRTPASQRSVPRCTVPPGHVVLSDRLSKEPINELLKNSVKVIIEGGLHNVDCYPISSMGVVFLGEESALSMDEMTRRKLDRLAKSSLSGLVIVECKNSTELYFNKLQEVIVFEIGLKILPVTCTEEAARIIVNISKKSPGNLFVPSSPSPSVDQRVLQAVELIPRTGPATAKLLLQRFGSLYGISVATEAELTEVVGKSRAQLLYSFLHSSS